MLDALPAESRAAIIGLIYTAFASGVAAFLGGFNSSNSAYNGVLAGVAKNLDRPIDFGKQGDREAIGRALVQQLRNSGGCTFSGPGISRC